MKLEKSELMALLPGIASQARSALTNLRMAELQLVPAEVRERDPALDRQAAVLDQSYYRLLRLVNNLSLAVSVEEGWQAQLRDRELVELVGEQCERAAGLAEALRVELRFVCARERHLCAVDGDALEQILYQLLSNALKFTPAGGSVRVELRVVPGRVLLSVEDTGCGISEERLEMLFESGFQAGRVELPVHGAGLGLALCRRLAEGQGGAMLVESHEGKGSRFTLSLPDRRLGGTVSDVRFDYSGGFNRTLLGLADALPVKAFLLRSQG
ncbi:MAG: sensor histidine kinase [Oscillibacter sp.]|nr:sensor histidine kinase [Oscillibacter sp.]